MICVLLYILFFLNVSVSVTFRIKHLLQACIWKYFVFELFPFSHRIQCLHFDCNILKNKDQIYFTPDIKFEGSFKGS